jgi:hypothetical protein
MSLAKLLNQPLELHKNSTATLDEYGNQKHTDLGAPIQIVGYLEQVSTMENTLDRDTIVTDWQAYFPADTNVTAFDRIVFGGQTFEVDGAPWQVYNPRVGSVSHIQAKLKVVL